MNTDNMTLSGETIDYGPCAFIEAHHPGTVFSSIDHRGRYAYGNQPNIAQWNLARLAEALLPLIATDVDQALGVATHAVEAFRPIHAHYWLKELQAKLGLTECADAATDLNLAQDYLRLLHAHEVDHTLGFRYLSHVLRGDSNALTRLFGEGATDWSTWQARWQQRLVLEPYPSEVIAHAMDQKNPCTIPRNHRVEEALSLASEHNDLSQFHTLLAAVRHPYEAPKGDLDIGPAPEGFTSRYQTFCGT